MYHKFVYSSHEGGAAAPEKPAKKPSEDEGDFAVYKNEDSPPVHKRPEGVEGALSTKMKQSTRNKAEESFIQSFEQQASENYEDLERRI